MGGNVFKTDEGPLTQRIATADVHPTIEFIEKITGLTFDEEDWLGTTGKKNHPDGSFENNSSGDLDLNTDANKVSKENLIAKLVAWTKTQNIPDDQIMNQGRTFTSGWIKDAGDQVHFRTPIQNGRGFVQTDFMFTDNPDYQRGAKRGGTASYSGKDRAILLSSIARARGYKFSPKFGLQNPETNELVSNDWNEIAQLLLGKNAKEPDTHTVETIITALRGDPDFDTLTAKAVEQFAKDGKELPESVITLADKNHNRIVELINRLADSR